MKKYIEIGVFILITILLIWGVTSCHKLREDKQNLETAISIAHDSTRHFKDENGKLVSENRGMILTVNQLRVDGKALGVDKSVLEKQVGNLNNLVSYYQTQATTKGHVTTVLRDTIIHVRDSVVEKDKVLQWSNDYLSLHGIYYPISDKLDVDYRYSTDLTVTVYYKHKRKGLFKILSKKELVCDIKFKDPMMRADSSRLIVIDKTGSHYGFWLGMGIGLGGGLLIK